MNKAFAILFFLAFLAFNANGQDRKYGMGLLLEDKNVYDSSPKQQKYRAFLPSSSDLSQYMPPVGHQGGISSCAAWTTNYAMRSYYGFYSEDESKAGLLYSPSYIYDYFAKGECERGATIPEMLDFMKFNGSLPVDDYPIKDQSCSPLPGFDALSSTAKSHQIETWIRINVDDLDTIKGKIHKGHPVAGGFLVPEELNQYSGGVYFPPSTLDWSEPLNADDTWPKDLSGIGFFGHAMTIVGYDDEKQAFKIMNSWGKEWGEEGYMWLDYEGFKNRLVNAYAFKIADKKPAPEPAPEVTPEPAPEVTAKEIESIISNHSLGFDCSLIDSTISENTIQLNGVMQSNEDKGRLIALIKNSFNDYKIQSSIVIRSWPTCELAITSYETEKMLKKNITLDSAKQIYKEGDELDVNISVNNAIVGYLNIFYLQANGTAIQINYDKEIVSKKTFTLSSLRKDEVLEISGPFGQEAIVGVVTKNKNLMTLTADALEDREFLTKLRIKLNHLLEGDQLLSVSTIFIETTK